MSDNKKVKLIAIYMYISELYEKELQYTCQRFSNNSSPEFTDAELMTVYLFAVSEEERFQVKKIHRFASDYLLSWFPQLPSYQAFNHRLNPTCHSIPATYHIFKLLLFLFLFMGDYRFFIIFGVVWLNFYSFSMNFSCRKEL